MTKFKNLPQEVEQQSEYGDKYKALYGEIRCNALIDKNIDNNSNTSVIIYNWTHKSQQNNYSNFVSSFSIISTAATLVNSSSTVIL